MLAMVISIFAAGLAGALVSVLQQRFGEVPATAASLILMTVTAVIRFFSFPGIAAQFAPLLQQGLKWGNRDRGMSNLILMPLKSLIGYQPCQVAELPSTLRGAFVSDAFRLG